MLALEGAVMETQYDSCFCSCIILIDSAAYIDQDIL